MTDDTKRFTAEKPYFLRKGDRLFISTMTKDAEIYYSLDGTEPTIESMHYTEPLILKGNGLVRAIALHRQFPPSPIAEFEVTGFGKELGDEPPTPTPVDGTKPPSGIDQWLRRYGWLMAVLIVILLVWLGVRIIADDNSETALPTSEVVELWPTLDGNSWNIRQMDGSEVTYGTAGAEIRATDETATDYRMLILTDYETREITFRYDRATGNLSSPELGAGHVEQGKGIVKLTIIFDGWKLERSK